MRKIYQILTKMRNSGVQRYLDEAEEMTFKLEEFLKVIPKSPPELERSRILLIMIATPRSLYSAMFAVRFAHHFMSDLYILHKGVHAPLFIEQADALAINVPFNQMVEQLQLEFIGQIITKYDIQFVIASGSIPNIRNILKGINVPILFIEIP